MKREVGIDAVAALSHLSGNGRETIRDLRKISVATPGGGVSGSVSLKTQPQLKHLRKLPAIGLELFAIQPKGSRPPCACHVGATTPARFDETILLQPRDRFPNHGAAHAHRPRQFELGRQSVSEREFAVADLSLYVAEDLLGQIAASTGKRLSRWLWCGSVHGILLTK